MLWQHELCRRSGPRHIAQYLSLHPLNEPPVLRDLDGIKSSATASRVRDASGSAADFLVDTVAKQPGDITVLALGPLTNIAIAMQRDPSFAEHVVRRSSSSQLTPLMRTCQSSCTVGILLAARHCCSHEAIVMLGGLAMSTSHQEIEEGKHCRVNLSFWGEHSLSMAM